MNPSSRREVVVLPGDDIGREVIPLAAQALRVVVPGLRVWDGEAGYEHAWRTGQAIDTPTLDLVRRVRYVLFGPERPFPAGVIQSATEQLTRALDLYAALYPMEDERLLVLEHGPEVEGGRTYREGKALSPEETWRATRLGNLVGELAQARRVAVVHDSEEPFAHAVVGGIHDAETVERMDAIFFVNHWAELVPEVDVMVASAETGRLLAGQLPAQVGRLLLGPRSAVATPAHSPLREQVGWGFANPRGALAAAAALLRYGWHDEEAAQRLEGAMQRASTRRRTPDEGGLHTLYEVGMAVMGELEG